MNNSLNGLEIAIIGMSGRFPGAKNISEYWQNLENGVESIHFYTQEELARSATEQEIINNSQFVPASGTN